MGYSLGFWLEDDNKTSLSSNDKAKNKVELHINYWSLEAKQACNYLDIGLRLELGKIESLKSINFYFPFLMEKENYMDNLGQVICSTDALTELIFNERLKSSFEGVNYKDINFDGKEGETLRVYTELEIGDDPSNIKFIPDSENQCTRIKIPIEIINSTPIFWEKRNEQQGSIFTKNLSSFKRIPHETKKIYHYFRFRLKLTSEHVRILSQNYKPQDRLLVSKFEKIEIIDFRLNELRDLPSSICNCLNKNFILEQIHFFLIRDIHDELKLSHTKYKRCRLLEKEVWTPYLKFKDEEAILPTQMLIYHFQKNTDSLKHIDRFNAFAKFVRVKITKITLLAFIVSVVCLGSLGSLLASFVEACIWPELKRIFELYVIPLYLEFLLMICIVYISLRPLKYLVMKVRKVIVYIYCKFK